MKLVEQMIIPRLKESAKLKLLFSENEEMTRKLAHLGQVCVESLRRGGKVVFAGNGGSFADAQHLSAELTSRFMFDRAALSSVVLGANNSAISAIGNDYGYAEVFARELSGTGKQGDVFIGLSTSGNSLNIIRAMETAEEIGMVAVAFTGESGGAMSQRFECIKVESCETARIQEVHITIGHILCEIIESSIFSSENT